MGGHAYVRRVESLPEVALNKTRPQNARIVSALAHELEVQVLF